MRMKRLIAMLLCAAMMCITLASCEEVIGGFDYDWEPEVERKISFDFYIISDSADGVSSEDQNTVESKVNQYLKEKCNTTIDIHFLTLAEYESTVGSIADSVSTEAQTIANSNVTIDGGDIVLIVGEDMFNSLMAKDVLVDLKSYLNPDVYKDYGRLNAQITSALLAAATVTDADGAEHLYSIPNDHVIGEYVYTVINREIAEGELNFSAQTELGEMLIVDGQPNELAAELIDSVSANLTDVDAGDVIWVENGSYEDKQRLESEGYICNVSEYPEATKSEAYQSSFGIFKHGDVYLDGVTDTPFASSELIYSRAMDVLYAIKADVTLRNLLQYGVENSHYKLVEKEVVDAKGNTITVDYVLPLENSTYKMNLLYTGDAFNAFYCDGVWTYDMFINGKAQNADAVMSNN